MRFVYRRLAFFLYFCTITVLFCLPGSVLPKESWLDKIWFDKWVHIGFFLALCLGACWAGDLSKKKNISRVLFAAIIYGILIEVVQDQYIPNRSFDLGDWIADIVGSLTGIWLWKRSLKGV